MSNHSFPAVTKNPVKSEIIQLHRKSINVSLLFSREPDPYLETILNIFLSLVVLQIFLNLEISLETLKMGLVKGSC